MCILKLLPLQGALLTDLIPRAMPWAKSFCPFRACWLRGACILCFGRRTLAQGMLIL